MTSCWDVCGMSSAEEKYPDTDLHLHTGDILLFGVNGCLSHLIAQALDSHWTHVAMVLQNPVFLNPQWVGTYVIQATVILAPGRESVFGVEVVPLANVLGTHRMVALRRLEGERPLGWEAPLGPLYQNMRDASFDLDPRRWLPALLSHWIGPTFQHWVHQETDAVPTSFFCSSLVGFLYCKLGLLPPDHPWSVMTPADFLQDLPLIDTSLAPLWSLPLL